MGSMTVYWRASDDPNGTSLRAETWAGAAGERSWKNVGPQLKPWGGWGPCGRWRAWLRFLCDRSCGGNDLVEEISKPVATGLAKHKCLSRAYRCIGLFFQRLYL